MTIAIRTHDDYVRIKQGFRKYYRAVLTHPQDPLFRVSRATFSRARDAQAYRDQFIARITSLRAVYVPPTDGHDDAAASTS